MTKKKYIQPESKAIALADPLMEIIEGSGGTEVKPKSEDNSGDAGGAKSKQGFGLWSDDDDENG